MNQIPQSKPHHGAIHKVCKLEQPSTIAVLQHDQHGQKEAVDLNRGDHCLEN